MKSEDGPFEDEPTGQYPIASTNDSRVTITGRRDGAPTWSMRRPQIDPETLLPHWTDAPTGQVPIVVAREAALNDDPWSAIPAPAWREGEADWVAHEDQFDASILAGEEKVDDARPWEFFLAESEPVEEIVAEAPTAGTGRRAAHSPTRVARIPLAGRAVRQSSSSSVSLGDRHRDPSRDLGLRASSSPVRFLSPS